MQIIDLSQPLRSGMPVYPGDPEVSIEVTQERDKSGWELRTISLGTHTGTHVDAPSHVYDGGSSLGDIPLDRFVGIARLVSAHQQLPEQTGLIFDNRISTACLETILDVHPLFVGGPSLDEELERSLLQSDIITFDGLVNLDQLPRDLPFTFCGLPLPITGGDGSPIRAVALIG